VGKRRRQRSSDIQAASQAILTRLAAFEPKLERRDFSGTGSPRIQTADTLPLSWHKSRLWTTSVSKKLYKKVTLAYFALVYIKIFVTHIYLEAKRTVKL